MTKGVSRGAREARGDGVVEIRRDILGRVLDVDPREPDDVQAHGAEPIVSATVAPAVGLRAVPLAAVDLGDQRDRVEVEVEPHVLDPDLTSRVVPGSTGDAEKPVLEDALGRKIRLRFDVVADASASPAAQEKRARADAHARAATAFRDDPFVQDLLTRFDARVKPDSIKPAE